MSQSLQPLSQGTAPVEHTPNERDPWSSDYGAFDEPRGISWRRRLSALRRFKFLILGCLALGAAGAYAAYEMIAPTYLVEGSIWLTEQNDDEEGPIRQSALLQAEAYTNLFVSFTVLEPVVREYRLYLNHAPEHEAVFADFEIVEGAASGTFVLTASDDGRELVLADATDNSVIERVAAGSPVGYDLGFRWHPTGVSVGDPVRFTVRTPRQAASELRSRLDQDMSRAGSWVDVQLEGREPARITAVLTAVMEQYVEKATQLKRENLDRRNTIIGEQLEDIEEKLEQAETALREFQIATITEPNDEPVPVAGLTQTQPSILNDYFDRTFQLQELDDQIARLESALQLDHGSSEQILALELNPAVGASSQMRRILDQIATREFELEALLEDYTEEFEPVQDLKRQLAEEKGKIPQMGRQVLASLRAQRSALDASIDARAEELREIPSRALTERQLQNQVRGLEALRAELSRRFETASLAARSTFADVRPLSWPVEPRIPFSDGRRQWMTIILLTSLGIGVVGALVLDQVDSRLRYATDVSDDLGLRILGVIPRIQGGRKGNAGQVREAFRDLRLHVEYAYGAAAPLMIAVTSPNEGEGKTTIAANLGMAFSSLGRRTLVVDGDTRRGNLHALLGGERKPGLTEFLQGTGSSDVIQETDRENLWMIGSGSRRSNSPELLGSQRMLALASAIKRRYEVIIFDCPPLQAGSDAFVLGAHAGNVLLVLRSGSSRKDVAAAKLEGFLRLPVRILGAALNDARAGLNFAEYAYYADYLPGYEAVDEEDAEEGDLVLTLPRA